MWPKQAWPWAWLGWPCQGSPLWTGSPSGSARSALQLAGSSGTKTKAINTIYAGLFVSLKIQIKLNSNFANKLYREKFWKDWSSENDFNNYAFLSVNVGRAHCDAPDEVLGKLVTQVVDGFWKEMNRVLCLEELHRTTLGVEGKPFHLEVTQPFYSVGNFIADHIRSPVKEVCVVKKVLLCLYKAVVRVWDDRPHLVLISWAVLALVFNVLKYCPRLPKQTSILWIYSIKFCLILNILKGDLLIDPFSNHRNLASKKSFLFIDFNNIPNIDG